MQKETQQGTIIINKQQVLPVKTKKHQMDKSSEKHPNSESQIDQFSNHIHNVSTISKKVFLGQT
jgi:hypothetical protein